MHPSWLASGYDIFWEFGFARDYLLPVADASFGNVRAVMAKYADAAVYTQLLFSKLRVPVLDRLQQRWVLSAEPLLVPTSGRFWTEHSERNWTTSIAAVLEVPESDRRRLGRWRAEASEDYVQTTKAIVHRIQRTAAARIRSTMYRNDFLDEEELLAEFGLHLTARGHSKLVVEGQLDRLRAFDPSAASAFSADRLRGPDAAFLQENDPTTP